MNEAPQQAATNQAGGATRGRVLRAWLDTSGAAWLAALGGGLWCASYAWPMLNPFTLDVVLKEDWAQHTLGWLFFRNEPLRLPLGYIAGFLHPLGTTLGYMDSIPWLALLLRPFSALLPVDFQYLGLWVVTCSAALAFVVARTSALWTPHWEQQALSGVLTAAAPTLLERLMHPALCAHALIACALGLFFVPAPTPSAARRCVGLALFVLVLSSATHPYLALMALAVLIALPWQLRSQLGSRFALAACLAEVACVALTFLAFGYIGRDMAIGAWGFGEYSANLNTFINSMGLSRLLPALSQSEGQYEGYSYMGAGWLALCVLALGLYAAPATRRRIRGPVWRATAWPLIAALAMALFAFATPLRWGTRDLLAVPVYERLGWLTQSFRSSGRFIWPLLYAIELAVVLCVLRALGPRRWLASAVLFAALALQLYDVDATRAQLQFGASGTRSYVAPEWALAADSFEHLVLYPAEIQSACKEVLDYRADVVSGLAYLAYRHHWTFNSGYAARYATGSELYCKTLDSQIKQGKLDAHTLYIARRWKLRDLRAAGAICGRLDQLIVCVAPQQHGLVEYLARHPP